MSNRFKQLQNNSFQIMLEVVVGFVTDLFCVSFVIVYFFTTIFKNIMILFNMYRK